MINKQNMWFLTLFSLILVLSVYYITMPNDLLLKTDVADKANAPVDNSDKVNVDVEESEVLVALRVDLEEKRENLKKEFQSVLTSSEATIDEKNEAYDKLTSLSSLVVSEEKLEKKIKDNYKLDSFVEIDNNEINVVVVSSTHDAKLANNIMRLIQEEFEDKVYVSVNFK